MKLKQLFFAENACYQSGKRHTVKEILGHSTGANNPQLSCYIAPGDGVIGPNRDGFRYASELCRKWAASYDAS